MKARTLGAIGLWLIALASCSDSTTNTGNGTSNDSLYDVRLNLQHGHYLPPGQTYALWAKLKGEASWRLIDTLGFNNHYADSIVYQSRPKLTFDAGFIEKTLVSVQPTGQITSPVAKLIAGDYTSGTSQLTSANVDGAGSFLDAQALVTFTTASSDTSRARSEFYLLQFRNGKPTPGVVDLPVARPGWKYALWVINENYYPSRHLFYGSFTDPAGPDGDTKPDELPYPGGYRSAPLTDPGGMIRLTLEPDFAIAASHVVPSQWTLLEVPLERFIHFDETKQMQNVSLQTIPSATLTLKKH